MDKQLLFDKCKIRLMKQPDTLFLTSILFSLKHKWLEEGTAAVSADTLFINPEFFEKLTDSMQEFLILHEVYHVMFQHVLESRRGNRCPDLWNKAADYVINAHLMDAGYQMPFIKDFAGPGKHFRGLHDNKYLGMSTEQIYDDLAEDSQGGGGNQGMPMDEHIMSTGEANDKDKGKLDSLLVKASVQTDMQSTSWGSLPGDIKRYIKKLLQPTLPWDRILMKYLSEHCKDDYSYKRFNKRYLPDFFLPTLYSEKVGLVSYVIDVSGSVTPKMLNAIGNCIDDAQKLIDPEKAHVISFDTEIHTNEILTNGREIFDVDIRGGGGTAIEPVFDWIIQNRPLFAVIFTDGCFSYPETHIPHTDLIWIIVNNKGIETMPQGRVIHYKAKE